MIIPGGENNPFLFKEFSLKYLSLLGTDWKIHTIVQTHVYRGLWLDMLMLFDSTRGTTRNLSGKTHSGKASAAVFVPLRRCLMEDLWIVYLYNKEQGMPVGRLSFTFKSQRTLLAKDLLPFLVVFLPFLQQNKNIILLRKDLAGYCCCYLLSHANNCLF